MNKLKSRKLWMAVLSIAAIIANKRLGLGLGDTDLGMITAAAGAYILGEGMADRSDAVKPE
jgi:hypothetical protein